MEQSNPEAFFDKTLSATDIQNIQDKRNLNDLIDLLDNDKISSEENEIIVINEVSKNIIGKCADDDPEELFAIQCYHQNEYYDPIESNCSRWSCNICRIKLGISTDTISWFYGFVKTVLICTQKNKNDKHFIFLHYLQYSTVTNT